MIDATKAILLDFCQILVKNQLIRKEIDMRDLSLIVQNTVKDTTFMYFLKHYVCKTEMDPDCKCCTKRDINNSLINYLVYKFK